MRLCVEVVGCGIDFRKQDVGSGFDTLSGIGFRNFGIRNSEVVCIPLTILVQQDSSCILYSYSLFLSFLPFFPLFFFLSIDFFQERFS